jgi:hypothetical protein
MSRKQPQGYSDRARYTLLHDPSGSLIINEPIGWRDDDNEFIRHPRYHGIWTQMTNSLEFFGNGADYINSVYNIYGVRAKIRLTKDERNPRTDIFERVYDGFLDLETWELKDRIVSVKFNSSNLFKIIKSRESKKIEITTEETMDGGFMLPLQTENLNLKGRSIFLKSLLETLPINSVSTAWRMNFSDFNFRWGVLGIPATVSYKSDELIHSILPDAFSKFGGITPDTAEVEQLFYAISNKSKTLDLSISVSFNLQIDKVDDLANEFLDISLAVYKNGIAYELKDRMQIASVPIVNGQTDVTYNTSINILEGDSVSLQWYGGANFGSEIGSDGDFNVNFQNIIASIDIQENSFYDPTNCQTVMPYELFDRMLNIITNRDDALYSEALGRTDTVPAYEEDGDESLTSMTSGFWIRGFNEDDLILDENGEPSSSYKPPKASFKDLSNSYFGIWNLGMGIERIGFEERVRIEKLSYFYNRNALIHLGNKNADGTFEYAQVNNVKRSIDTKNYYSGVEVGYDKWEDYEEAMGLDEYNALSTFTTSINTIDNLNREGVSKYRADSYGIEFARRKQEIDFPTEDTNYDKYNFFVDCKRVGIDGGYTPRLAFDDFDQFPTGIFSPETAFNLRLSPVNILLRRGWNVQSGLTKYPTEYVRYASSTGNTKMTTQLRESQYPYANGKAYSENGNIQNQELQRARYVPEFVEFEYEVDFDLLQQVQGTTVVLGEEIVNFYGLVQFRNENNVIEKGFLLNLKPNGAGKWKLLKYNNQ